MLASRHGAFTSLALLRAASGGRLSSQLPRIQVRGARLKARDHAPRPSLPTKPALDEAPRWKPKPPPQPSPESPRPRNLVRNFIFGSFALLFGSYVGRTWASLNNEERTEDLDISPDQSTIPIYDRIAPTFDEAVETTERRNGILTLRKDITSKCSGDVLEVAVGTGRNAEYYNLRNCRTITMLDESGPMLEFAEKSWAERTKKSVHAEWREWTPEGASTRKVNFYQMNAADDIPLPDAASGRDDKDRGFTTILSTFSLCSMPQPAATLAQLCSLLAPPSPTDPEPRRVLLLEHGQSYFGWINKHVLDKSAPGHANRFGCWWNKDIGAIVREAAEEAGMEVMEMRRKWLDLGTTWIVEMRPKDGVWEGKRTELRRKRLGGGERKEAR